MYYTKQVISFESVQINVIQIRFVFASYRLFTFSNTLLSSPTLAPLCFIADGYLHCENTRSTYAWDKGAVIRPMTALKYSHIGLLSNASITVHQSLRGGCLVQQVEPEIILLAGRPN